jgi:hypothetical protein
VNDFVDECRREWRRLQVPDPVANEMAADLEADLREAEAEGTTAEEVLGAAVFDPRGFAASWAAARGVIPPPVPASATPARRTRLLVLAAAVAVIMVGAGLLGSFSATRFGEVRVAAAAPIAARPSGPSRERIVVPFPLPFARSASGVIVAVRGPGSPVGPVLGPLGALLVIAGIAALGLVLLVWAISFRSGSSSRPFGDGG